MKRRDSMWGPFQNEALPFTMFLGRNWELWMAFRELYANTLDEGGTIDTIDWAINKADDSQETMIIVGPSDEFSEVFRERDTIFLPKGKRGMEQIFFDGETPKAIEIFHQPSDYLYYRGMRVQKLEKPSIMTYNVLSEQPLTEDRTLKDPWWVEHQVMSFIGHSSDRALIHHFLNATEDHWEATWNFDIHAPGAAFVNVLREVQERDKARAASSQPVVRNRTYREPIYRSPRMTTVIEKAAPPPPQDPKTRLWWHFADLWERLAVPITDQDERIIQAVLKDLKDSETEYDPNAPVQLDVPEVVLTRRIPNEPTVPEDEPTPF